MGYSGIETALDCTNLASVIKAAGIDFVGRYYRWPSSSLPALSYNEALALSNAGLNVVALWEWASNEISNFSLNNGKDQGSSAYNQALNAHQPAGTPIYFAVDSDFDSAQVAGPVNDYFSGVASAFNHMGNGQAKYTIGVYGSGLVCNWLLNQQQVQRTWLSGSTGWQGYSFGQWDIKQNFSNDPGIQGMTFGPNGDYDADDGGNIYGGFSVL